MILMVAVFLIIVFITFSICMFMLRPTREQTQAEKRMNVLMISRAEAPTAQAAHLIKVNERRAFGWLEDAIGDQGFIRTLRILILQSHSTTTPGSVLVLCASLFLAAGSISYVFLSMEWVSLGIACFLAFCPIFWLRFQRHRRVTAFNAALPDCIETCARSLRAGHSIVSAIDIVAGQSVEPAKEEFAEVFKKQNYGLPLRDALQQMLERMPSSDLHVVVTGILVQKDTGGNLADIMDRIAIVIRDRIRIAGEVRTHTAQGRLTRYILVLLPIILLLLINLLNPGYSNILFTNPTGQKMLYIGVGLLIAGGLLIRKIIKGIEV